MKRLGNRIFSSAVALIAAASVAACGGGGGGGTSPIITPTSAPTTPTQSNLVTSQFVIVVPSGTSAGARKPQFVSSASLSITITLTNPPAGLSPTSVSTNISGSTCTVATPCIVNGPPSPPGVADTFQLTTFDATGGAGNALDSGSVTFTPTAGQANTAPTVTMKGIPFSITITGVPSNFNANTASQTANLTVTVKDHSGQTITGTYANPVRITDLDAEETPGHADAPFATNLTGTHVVGGGCPPFFYCVDLLTDTDTITLNYGGLAENPVVLASSATGVTGGNAGTATFTPIVQAIVKDSGPTTTLGGDGIDLFTNDAGSTVGYSGTEQYKEPGFTNSPYSKSLSITGAGACSTFATLSTGANDTTHGTPFTATAIASPVAGVCTITVTDSLTDQPNALPTFKVTYTTETVPVQSKYRH
jgi:hypothetical protein